jgi:hypothetical protein
MSDTCTHTTFFPFLLLGVDYYCTSLVVRGDVLDRNSCLQSVLVKFIPI